MQRKITQLSDHAATAEINTAAVAKIQFDGACAERFSAAPQVSKQSQFSASLTALLKFGLIGKPLHYFNYNYIQRALNFVNLCRYFNRYIRILFVCYRIM